jgi:diguanylate cyclase (GGDEF)-like protein
MAAKQSDPQASALAQSLVVLSGDVSLCDHLRTLARQRPRGTLEIVPAADPEAARAALSAHGQLAIILYDLRGQRESAEHLFAALPVLRRQGAVVALVDDDGGTLAAAALEAGAIEVVAMSDLSPVLLVHIVRHALALRASDQRLVKLRLHEPVIGIPSQMLFWEILSLAVRRAKRNRDFFAIMLLDFDNLPDGDSPDGPFRDLALRDLVARIQPILRGSDTIARLETQQLAILVEAMPRVEDVQIVAEKIIEEVERPLESGSGPVALDVAIGIALFPTSADSAEAMLARATDAMLQARERGRNRFAFA